ncbi:hypothetical protein K8P03_05210 [Anaerococcus murdochii]|uniref:Uncharacterized protein n=1 Tax=Anaerococcus murdochii TaxID=411577 RepID=A0ABS7SYT1_9FIRM|nr:hypothetical protein [Anaerococcus murdochii]MBZ2386697.1 hypothetical protein [Anaerococcus murdochii]
MKESLTILISIITGLAVLMLVKEVIRQGKLAGEKIENEKVKFAFNQVLDLAETIVDSLNQTVVKPLKESETLTFDVKEQRKVLDQAKARIKNNLDDKSKELLEAYLGSSQKVDYYIEDAIEAQVFKSKKK